MNYGSLLTNGAIEALRGAIGTFAGLVLVPAARIHVAKALRAPVQMSIASSRFALVVATPPKDVAQGVKPSLSRRLFVEGSWSDTPKHYVEFWTLSVELGTRGHAPDEATEVAIEPALALTGISVLELRSTIEDESVWCDVGLVFHGGRGRRLAIGPHSTFGLELLPDESQIDELIDRYPVRVRV